MLNLRGLVGDEDAFVGGEEHSRSTSSCSHGEPCLQGANISVAGTGRQKHSRGLPLSACLKAREENSIFHLELLFSSESFLPLLSQPNEIQGMMEENSTPAGPNFLRD